jgi:TatD DNase family protein
MDFKVVTDESLQRKQRLHFEQFIELSEKIKKPLIIHSRGAERAVVEMLESSKVKKANLHMFGGRKSLVRKANDMGLHISVPPVCVRLEHFKMIVKEMNINQLLTETDAPWLGHIPRERNLPENVRESIKFIAQQKGFDETEVANNLWLNYQNLFG